MVFVKIFRDKKFINLALFLFLISANIFLAQPSFNIASNGEFDNQLKYWQLFKSDNASAAFSVNGNSVLSGPNSLQIDISKGSDSLKDIRLIQSIQLQKGRNYSIYFYAKASSPSNLKVAFSKESDETNYLWSGEIISLNQNSQKYGPITYKNFEEDNYRGLSFLMGGKNEVTIWLDSIVVNISDNPEHIRKEEAVQIALRDTLRQLMKKIDNKFFKISAQSFIDFTGDPYNLLFYDYSLLNVVFNSFCDSALAWSPRKLDSYLNRKRTFLISWKSKTDGKRSYACLMPPENFNPDKTYPLYLTLHGYMNQAFNPIEYLAYRYSPEKIYTEPYEDGYMLSPWGRGNLFYQGIGETDVWDAISALEAIAKIDHSRMYLTGHSMGGFGAWYIGQKTPNIWAAIGIQAAVYSSSTENLLTMESASKLKNVPTYFVCGDNDGLFSSNQTAYKYVQATGNMNTVFVSFHGGHEKLYEDVDNMHHWLKNWVNKNPVEVEKNNSGLLSNYKLESAYPNPFNPVTTIGYSLPEEAKINLEIFNVLGRKIYTLKNKIEQAGEYQITWNALGNTSGIYFCRMIGSGKQSFQKTIKLILMK